VWLPPGYLEFNYRLVSVEGMTQIDAKKREERGA